MFNINKIRVVNKVFFVCLVIQALVVLFSCNTQHIRVKNNLPRNKKVTVFEKFKPIVLPFYVDQITFENILTTPNQYAKLSADDINFFRGASGALITVNDTTVVDFYSLGEIIFPEVIENYGYRIFVLCSVDKLTQNIICYLYYFNDNEVDRGVLQTFAEYSDSIFSQKHIAGVIYPNLKAFYFEFNTFDSSARFSPSECILQYVDIQKGEMSASFNIPDCNFNLIKSKISSEGSFQGRGVDSYSFDELFFESPGVLIPIEFSNINGPFHKTLNGIFTETEKNIETFFIDKINLGYDRDLILYLNKLEYDNYKKVWEVVGKVQNSEGINMGLYSIAYSISGNKEFSQNNFSTLKISKNEVKVRSDFRTFIIK